MALRVAVPAGDRAARGRQGVRQDVRLPDERLRFRAHDARR